MSSAPRSSEFERALGPIAIAAWLLGGAGLWLVLNAVTGGASP